MKNKKKPGNQGFASMDLELRRKYASQGGKKSKRGKARDYHTFELEKDNLDKEL